MEKSTLYNKLLQPTQYTLQEKLDIQNAKTHYPYCALLHLLDLLSDKAAHTYLWEERLLQRAMLHIPQPQRLIDVLPLVEDIVAAPTPVAPQPDTVAAAPVEEGDNEADAYDVMSEINAYQEVSFKTAPKSEILSQFLEVGGVQSDFLAPSNSAPVEELAKKSIDASETIVTETMAVVFEKQGKLDKAIAVYEKLLTKVPEKSSTFAARIEELKKQQN